MFDIMPKSTNSSLVRVWRAKDEKKKTKEDERKKRGKEREHQEETHSLCHT